MRVLVCGDRNWTDYRLLSDTLDGFIGDISCIIEGECRGADRMARDWALRAGVRVLRFPAGWERYGKAAGVIRNQQMLEQGKPDLVVAFHNDIEHSRGTRDMVYRARIAGVKVMIIKETNG